MVREDEAEGILEVVAEREQEVKDNGTREVGFRTNKRELGEKSGAFPGVGGRPHLVDPFMTCRMGLIRVKLGESTPE